MNSSNQNTLIKEAIILAGGFGTRLRETVPDLPKCMAEVAGQPFLTYVIRHLLSQGIEKFVFSLGYRHEIIEEFIASKFPYLTYSTVVEKTPLGTGGAIRFALEKTSDRDILIVNGDTLFRIDVDDLSDRHVERQAECTVALKPMENFDRYGAVETDDDLNIIKFKEKKFEAKGMINGGVYLLNRVAFLKREFPAVFSFEKDYLEALVETSWFIGVVQPTYFIDIGIPEDYYKAQQDLKYSPINLSEADPSWTIFLDRDGVINYNKDDSYVFNTGEFEFIPGSAEAIKILSKIFGKVIVITNQRGIGKGLMDEKALGEIHQHMINEIEREGGRIDALYYCAINDDKHHDRKPNPGMILEAAHMYPEINLTKSIMVGDKMSDMQLGRNVGAYTVLITSTQSGGTDAHPDVDMKFNSLREFAAMFESV